MSRDDQHPAQDWTGALRGCADSKGSQAPVSPGSTPFPGADVSTSLTCLEFALDCGWYVGVFSLLCPVGPWFWLPERCSLCSV